MSAVHEDDKQMFLEHVTPNLVGNIVTVGGYGCRRRAMGERILGLKSGESYTKSALLSELGLSLRYKDTPWDLRALRDAIDRR